MDWLTLRNDGGGAQAWRLKIMQAGNKDGWKYNLCIAGDQADEKILIIFEMKTTPSMINAMSSKN